MDNNSERIHTNNKITLKLSSGIHGMIDAHAYMVKFVILFLFVFTVSYAQNLDNDVVVNLYYQILLKKWEASADRQKLELADCTPCQMSDVEALNVVKKALYKYNKEWNLDNVRVGKNGEYILVRARESPQFFDKEQIWFLVSTTLKKIVATHNDKIKSDIRVGDPVLGHGQKEEADRVYKRLLEKINSGYGVCPRRWRLNILGHNNIDSLEAISIAIEMAKECYNSEMTALSARLMGDYEEHWMVYCFPTIPIEDDCYFVLTLRHEGGSLFLPRMEVSCPCPVAVLISKENGDVLLMEEHCVGETRHLRLKPQRPRPQLRKWPETNINEIIDAFFKQNEK